MDFGENHTNDTAIEDWSGYEQEAEGVDKEVATAARKREPLVNVEWLSLHGMYGLYLNMTTDRSMFAHCPNLKRLDMSRMIGLHNSNTFGEFIGKNCPRIESVIYSSFDFEEHSLLAFKILNSLPEQQITHLDHSGMPFDSNSTTVTFVVQRHSAALRDIRLEGNYCMAAISVSVILKECSNLDTLQVPFSQHDGFYVTLDDALEHPWGCTKLTQLIITISGCELPFEPGVQPY